MRRTSSDCPRVAGSASVALPSALPIDAAWRCEHWCEVECWLHGQPLAASPYCSRWPHRECRMHDCCHCLYSAVELQVAFWRHFCCSSSTLLRFHSDKCVTLDGHTPQLRLTHDRVYPLRALVGVWCVYLVKAVSVSVAGDADYAHVHWMNQSAWFLSSWSAPSEAPTNAASQPE
jgi:hypothetical protein